MPGAHRFRVHSTSYGAVLVFGGAMHADQDQHHPWLREENLFLTRLLDLHTPVLGICRGAQLLAQAAHAPVFPADEAEVGWFEVELTDAGVDDPLPRPHAADVRGVPVALLRARCTGRRDRAGAATGCARRRSGSAKNVWGVQFHPEVTLQQVQSWVDEEEALPVDAEALLAETRYRIESWNTLGRISVTASSTQPSESALPPRHVLPPHGLVSDTGREEAAPRQAALFRASGRSRRQASHLRHGV